MTDEIFAETTKVTVNLNARSMSALYRLAAELGLSRTDCMNRALQGYQVLLAAQPGSTLHFTQPDRSILTFVRAEDGVSDRLGRALRLLKYAFHLRSNGERAPGGNETWAQFDRECEAFLRAEVQP